MPAANLESKTGTLLGSSAGAWQSNAVCSAVAGKLRFWCRSLTIARSNSHTQTRHSHEHVNAHKIDVILLAFGFCAEHGLIRHHAEWSDVLPEKRVSANERKDRGS